MTAAPGRTTLLDAGADLFALALTLAHLPERPEHGLLRAFTLARLDAFHRVGVESGHAPRDVAEAEFALCALLDAVVLQVRGATADAWCGRPLVLERHAEADAEEGFRRQLAGLLAEPSARPGVLEVYAACMVLGFPGADAAEDGAEADSARAALRAAGGTPPALAPAVDAA